MKALRSPAISLARRAFAVLALLSLLVVLVRPVCDALEAHAAVPGSTGAVALADPVPGHGPADDTWPCCNSIDEAAPVTPGTLPSAAAVPPAFPIVVVAAPRLSWSVAPLAAASPPDRPPVSLRYHVRSSRILA